MNRYIDLTHRIEESMPVFQGDPPPEIRQVMTLGPDICTVQSIRFNNHIGTHLDAPSHFIEGGMTVDQIPLESLIGKAVILDTPSPSPLDDPGQTIHKTLLGAGIVILESVNNLTLIDRDQCQIIVLPPPIKDFSGVPCRVVAVLE